MHAEPRRWTSGHGQRQLRQLGGLAVRTVAIDIPIGLPSEGRRQADVAARELLGPLRSSVFFTPVRKALLAPTHAEASATAEAARGSGHQPAAASRQPICYLSIDILGGAHQDPSARA